MAPEVLATLLLPFEKGHLPVPGPGRALFLRAEPGPGLDAAWRAAIVAEQTFKPAADRLRRFGVTMLDDTDLAYAEAVFDLALVPVTKSRAETYAMIEQAWRKLVDGGVLVVAGEKGLGAASIERTVAALHPLEGAMPKHGCRVFWLRKGEMRADFESALYRWRTDGLSKVAITDGTFVTMPGLFAPEAVDAGSMLLADTLPILSGAVADLGSGWGYLAYRILHWGDGVTSIDLYEAERDAIACSKDNLSEVPSGAVRTHHWHDVTTGLPKGALYDAIVTNPPFHQGRAGDPGIGAAFITAAHGGLRKGGRLYLVANRHLPYEAVLARLFGGHEVLAEANGYKVLAATRR